MDLDDVPVARKFENSFSKDLPAYHQKEKLNLQYRWHHAPALSQWHHIKWF